MTLIRPFWVLLSLCVLFVGCASTPSHVSTDSAHWVEPIRSGNSSQSTGWLVARVEGSPRNIEYTLNGVKLEPEERIEWWKDARIRLQLRPGLYELEATYDVRAFAGRGIEYRITSRHPINVRAGVETEVEAHLEKDWRGIPASEVAYFVTVTDERRQRKEQAAMAAAARDQAEDTSPEPMSFSSNAVPMDVDPQATPEIIEEIQRADALAAAALADQIVIHGNEYDGGTGTVSIQSATGEDPVQSAPDYISIRGPQNNAAGEDLAPAAAALGVGAAAALSSDKDALEDRTPAAPEPYVLEGAEEFGITVVIESIPSGATVTVDDQVVGQTPVHVHMDPRADHIVEFAYDGCGDYVRLLSSNSWREGRDTTVQVQLYCDD